MMVTWKCEKCGAVRHETPFCHGPMKCYEEEKLRELLEDSEMRLRTVTSRNAAEVGEEELEGN